MALFRRGTASHPRARAQRLELLIGLLGFFTLMAFIQTVVFELRGDPAGWSALVLLVLAVGLGLAIRAWLRIKT